MFLRAALAAALFLCVVPVAAQSAPVSSHAMVYSCCTPPGLKERIFAESAALGAEYVRVDVQMGDVFEREGGGPAPAPDWRGLDEVIELAKRHRVKVLGILLHPPSWLSSCPERFPHHVRCPATDATEFGRLAGQIAAHAGSAIDHWEILNEPDGEWAFEGSPEEYSRMLVAAHGAIKLRAPGDLVVLGGVMRPHEAGWLERVMAVPGAAGSFDIANVHLRGSVEAVVSRYREVRERLARRGFAGPLWVTEHGYAADPAFQSDPAYATGDVAQAGYLTQSLVGLGEAGAEQVFVTLRDQGTEGAYATEGLTRIVEKPGYEVQRRPAFAAVRRVASSWAELMAWRSEQRRHEQMLGLSEAAATLWRAQALTGRQRLRQARALAADTRQSVIPAPRRLRRAQALVARYRRELGWQRAVLADYRARAALHSAAAEDLRVRIAGP
jgi:hypothetical protein